MKSSKKKTSEKVFVAGAAGFIGQRVCRLLSESGYQVYALIYSDIEWERVDKYAKKCLKSDLLLFSDLDSLQRYLKKEMISHVIDLVGTVDYKQDYESAKRANVDTTKAIVDLCIPLTKAGILKKLVYTGSVASRGFHSGEPGKDEWFDETKSYYRKGLSVYCDVKLEAEELVRRSKLPVVIVEPGSLVGQELHDTTTTNVTLIRRIIKGIPILCGGASYTSVERVAQGIVSAMEIGKNGETYLLGGENMRMRDFAVLVREVMAKRFPGAKIPSLPVITLPQNIASVIGAMNLMVNKQQALLGSNYHYINSSKAARDLGYQHSLEDLKNEIASVLKDLVGQ